MPIRSPNIELLILVAKQLRPLLDEFVFLGGCATALFITDPATPEVRSTKDVDVITEVASIPEYYALADKLRGVGFSENPDLICRWQCKSLILDVMPTEEKILGFSNDWYKPAIQTAQCYNLTKELQIKLVTAPYFLATKLEAFHGRGKNDYLSHDMEDIISVIDGRIGLLAEVQRADKKLRSYLAQEFTHLLKDDHFTEALPGHLPGDKASQARFPILINRIKELSKV